MPRTAVSTVLMAAYTMEAMSAPSTPLRCTPGTTLEASRNASTWNTSTTIPVTTGEYGAMTTSTPTLTTALNSAISTTAANAAHTESTVTLRSSQAVAAKAIVATTSVISSRLTSATRPPDQFHSTSICVR